LPYIVGSSYDFVTVTDEETAIRTESVRVEQRRHERTEGRLLVLAAIVISALTLRVAVTAFSPLAERIGADIGYSTAVIGVFGMIPTAMFAASGLLTPLFVRRLGLERTALVAMVMAGLGMLIRATVSSTGALFVFSALALGGMGIGNVVIPPLVKRYFPDRLAVVSSLYITMVQLGTVAPALIAVPVAEAHGWRISLGLWAVLGFAAAPPWIGVLRDRRGRDLVDTTGFSPAGAEPKGKVWRSPVAWGLAGMFGTTSLTTYAMLTWLPTILGQAGASAAFGGTMVGLFALVGLVVAFPFVVACAAFFFIAFAGLLVAPMGAPILWVLLLGLGPSTFPMALTLINMRTRTAQDSASLSGFTQGVGYAVACVGPLLFGMLHTATDGWLAPFAMLSVAVLVLLVSAWQACKPRMLEDTWN
jgi:CP family cyanate transporter-like MFS transporter